MIDVSARLMLKGPNTPQAKCLLMENELLYTGFIPSISRAGGGICVQQPATYRFRTRFCLAKLSLATARDSDEELGKTQ